MRYRSLLLATGVVASGLLIGPATAEATPQAITAHCSWMLPANLTLRAPRQDIWVKKGPDCPKTANTAMWMGRNAVGADIYASGFGVDGGGWLNIAYTAPCGQALTWTGWEDGYAHDANNRPVAILRSAKTLTKCGAAVQLTGVRKSTRTTLTARPTYYNEKTGKFVRHHGRVLFQKRDLGSTTWTDLGWAYPNATTGAASYTITTNRSRDYRTYVPSGKTVTHAYSATKRV
ncbi:hypothetical protein GCM10029976_043770 [Kribbella albertanoniae]|uniref:Uncharacterized protein n=1 Tax=Kribbella albertanoniae TaxID=1266829 RepID=A0A4R4PI46_9ACTN|nr:hypothetical protein [Kribbella albertanoniae]TDC21652.1 hypothetical protein E1261_32855 [Kribbella albertanoniae]